MRFFLDQNIPLSVVEMIRQLGFEAEHAKDAGLKSAPDKKITEYAKKRNAILITKDLDFGSLISYPKGSHHGLIVLRLPDHFTGEQITKTLKRFLTKTDSGKLVGSLIILEIEKYRIRKL